MCECVKNEIETSQPMRMGKKPAGFVYENRQRNGYEERLGCWHCHTYANNCQIDFLLFDFLCDGFSWPKPATIFAHIVVCSPSTFFTFIVAFIGFVIVQTGCCKSALRAALESCAGSELSKASVEAADKTYDWFLWSYCYLKSQKTSQI